MRTRPQWEIDRNLSGRHSAATVKYKHTERGRAVHARADAKWNRTGRKRAHDLMRKYGMTLGQAERLGVVPPDVQEALNGNR